MHISAEPDIPSTEAIALYESVGWTAYTSDPGALMRSLAGSHRVLTARDDDRELLGLARTISDGETICYVQDVLVRPDRQRREIGRRLMQRLRDDYRHCRQFLLTTDGADDTAHRFYRAVGLVPISEQGLVTFGAGS